MYTKQSSPISDWNDVALYTKYTCTVSSITSVMMCTLHTCSKLLTSCTAFTCHTCWTLICVFVYLIFSFLHSTHHVHHIQDDQEFSTTVPFLCNFISGTLHSNLKFCRFMTSLLQGLGRSGTALVKCPWLLSVTPLTADSWFFSPLQGPERSEIMLANVTLLTRNCTLPLWALLLWL